MLIWYFGVAYTRGGRGTIFLAWFGLLFGGQIWELKAGIFDRMGFVKYSSPRMCAWKHMRR